MGREINCQNVSQEETVGHINRLWKEIVNIEQKYPIETSGEVVAALRKRLAQRIEQARMHTTK